MGNARKSSALNRVHRLSAWYVATRATPSLVPEFDVTVHIVLDRVGKDVRVYREVDEAEADLETLIDDILSGQYYDPCRIVAFNTAEGWARDVTEDVAREV